MIQCPFSDLLLSINALSYNLMFLFNLYQQIKCNITDAIWALVGFFEIYQKIKFCTSFSNTFRESFAKIKMCL